MGRSKVAEQGDTRGGGECREDGVMGGVVERREEGIGKKTLRGAVAEWPEGGSGLADPIVGVPESATPRDAPALKAGDPSEATSDVTKEGSSPTWWCRSPKARGREGVLMV